jgi:hypothetical protein
MGRLGPVRQRYEVLPTAPMTVPSELVRESAGGSGEHPLGAREPEPDPAPSLHASGRRRSRQG